MDEYALTSVTCTGIGSGPAMANLPSDIVTLDAAATAAGNIIACTFTNTAFPLLSVSKVLTSVNGVAATPGEVVHGGDVLVYTINVNDTGAGPGSAAVTDPVPVTVSVSTVTCTTSTGSSCTPGPQTNAVAGSVTLLANGTATYLVTGTAAGNLTNTAPVTPGCATQRGGGTGTTPPTTATDKPVFTQTKTADQSSYFVGAPITYTISVANTGAAAGTASVADAVPSIVAVSAVACSASAGSSCVPGPQTNTVAGSVTLLTNGTATYLVTGTAAGNLTNTAPVTPTTPGCTTQCGGGTGTTPPITAGNIPFFTESKTADQSSYHVGQPITYTITVNNTGAGSGSASVTDPVPAPVTVTTVTCTASTGSSGTPGPQTDAVAGSVTLLANGTATFLITGTVASTGSLVNTATITATTPGCTTQCGGSPASTPITQNTAAVDLAATKTLDQPAITAGAPITYLARMSNAGPVRSRLELHDADEYRGRPGVAVTGPRSVDRRRLPEGRRM